MIRMLLTGCMVHICQYWTWPRGNVLGLGLTDEDVGLLRGLDCDILVQGLIEFDRIIIPPSYTFFSGSPIEKNSGVKHV
jgi:hypothetical protein